MSDRDEIVEKINLYALGVDAQRWDLFDRIFIEKCDADYGGSAHWTDREQFKADFGAFHAPFDATQHMMMNHQVTIMGEKSAQSLTYGSWRLIRYAAADAQALGPLWDGTGWYDDEWVKTNSGWQIARRVCRVIWFNGNPAVKETIPGVSFDTVLDNFRTEGQEGRLGFLKAIS